MPALSSVMKDKQKAAVPTARELIAYNTRALREQAGTSQEGLAAAAGFHRTYISQVERCVANISADGLDKLAGALQTTVQRLFELPSSPR